MASTCGLRGPPVAIGGAEIGYGVFEPFRGAEASPKTPPGALERWAFEQGEPEVYASASPGNAPSLAVVRALGFT